MSVDPYGLAIILRPASQYEQRVVHAMDAALLHAETKGVLTRDAAISWIRRFISYQRVAYQLDPPIDFERLHVIFRETFNWETGLLVAPL
jgi:hypothetical protein